MTESWAKAAVAGNFVFQTARLLIRPLAAEDEQLYLDLYTSPTVMAYIAPPLDTDKAKHSFQIALRLNAKVPFKRLFLAICLQGQPVGLCAVNQWNPKLGTVEVGMMVVPAWQGQGYGTEAKLALSQQVRQIFNGAQVWTQTDPANKAAVHSNITAGYQADPNQSGIFWFTAD